MEAPIPTNLPEVLTRMLNEAESTPTPEAFHNLLYFLRFYVGVLNA